MILTLATGLALAVAGLCLIGRGILLSGRVLGWPSAPWWFCLMVELGGGLLAAEGGVILVHGLAAGFMLASLAGVYAVIEAATLFNLARQRAPKEACHVPQ